MQKQVSMQTADVVVVGLGIAGACAALEARAAGADVLVLERASGGGGTSALSSGIFYLGGGTRLQSDLGVEDDPENLYRYMAASCAVNDTMLLRTFCEGSAEHFDWLEAQGIDFSRTLYKDKHMCPPTAEGLLGTGNEKIWPYRDVARPALRGHRVNREGDNAGLPAMEALLARCADAGIRIIADATAQGLLTEPKGRVSGIVFRKEGSEYQIKASGGVILATGGFQMNVDMVSAHLPFLLDHGQPIGTPYSDGSGIVLGQAIGAAVEAMGAVHATACFYPPAQLIKGLIVNCFGERFVAEDSYHGRTAACIFEQPGRKAYLILDADIFAYPDLGEFFHYRLIDGWDSIAEMESGLRMPAGALCNTIRTFNAHAARGEDPLLGKHADWLKPLDHGPYAAFDLSADAALYHYHSLGGLRVNARAEVISTSGQIIHGLYAAGSCAAGIVQSAKGYGSGMSLSGGSFFGRIAGRNAAHAVN